MKMKIEQFEKKLKAIEALLHYTFQQPHLLYLALVHRSYWNEHRTEVEGHNERLEFLGDAVLNLIIANQLYTTMPHVHEGELTQIRAQLVDIKACFSYCYEMGLDQYVLLGKGEQGNQGRGRESIVADFFEALVGALFLDGGLAAVQQCFEAQFVQHMRDRLVMPITNWKSKLQEIVQQKYQQTPTYRTLDESGAKHAQSFRVAVLIGERIVAEGSGASKKEAQMEAARRGVERLAEDASWA